MRLHVIAPPNTQVTRSYSWHPYTQKVRKFCDMMESLDHDVYLYAGELNDARCTQWIPCITEDERARLFPERWPSFDPEHPGRRLFADNVIEAMSAYADPGDALCVIEGVANRPIAEKLSALVPVEFGVGYEATFATRRVFESYAWMHAVHGTTVGAFNGVGNFLDEVIPNSYEVHDFGLGSGHGDYLLYMGRLTERKGLRIVAQIAQETGLQLVVAGQGDTDLVPMNAEYYGLVGPGKRAELLGGARCILAPTLNVEPFGGTVVEAQFCGTPAITTDWGAFVETVEDGKTGYRCRDLAQFVQAVDDVQSLDRRYIWQRAIGLYSTDVVRHQYDGYLRRVVPDPCP